MFDDEESISLLKATLDATDDGIFTVDVAGKVGFVNRRFLEMWRITEDVMRLPEFMQRLPFVLDQLKDPEGYLRRAREYYRHPERPSFDVLEFKDGRIFERYSHPQWIGGVCVGRVLSFRDVTEQRRAERERDRLLEQEQAARAEAERAVKVREEFLSIASHELRTPLASLQLGIQCLRASVGKDPTLPTEERRLLDIVERQSLRLGTLVEALLEVSRILSGRLDLTLGEVDLVKLSKDILSSLTWDIERSGCKVSLVAPAAVVGSWDRARVEQVLMNLLSNALKYGRHRPVEVRIETSGELASMAVQDHGEGIAPEVLPRIFDKFERGVDARHYGGLGLGLYISKRIVEAHGGSIRANSRVGSGSTFTVELPLRRAEHT